MDQNNKQDEGIENDDQNQIEFQNEQLYLQCIELLEKNESPLYILDQIFPDRYPRFDHFFLEKFSDFYRRNGPDCDILLNKIAFSCRKNAYQLANLHILDCLYLKAPDTFDLIFKIMESNNTIINHFLNSGGIFVLAVFSIVPELQLNVSQIFLYVSKNYFNFGQKLLPPNGFNNYDKNVDISYEYFFHNLLFSSNPDVQINCLKSIDNIFNNLRNDLQSLPIILINFFDTLLQNYPYLIPSVLDVAYNFDICCLTMPFLDACHFIFQQNVPLELKQALFFISKPKNMEFICSDSEISEFIFTDLLFITENSNFEISTLSTCVLILFMTLCNTTFFQRSIDFGIFQFLSNALFSMSPTIFESNNFDFIISKLECFLNRLMVTDIKPNLSSQGDDLNELIESLQPFTTYGDEKIANSAISCISFIQKFLGIET